MILKIPLNIIQGADKKTALISNDKFPQKFNNSARSRISVLLWDACSQEGIMNMMLIALFLILILFTVQGAAGWCADHTQVQNQDNPTSNEKKKAELLKEYE